MGHIVLLAARLAAAWERVEKGPMSDEDASTTAGLCGDRVKAERVLAGAIVTRIVPGQLRS